MSRKQKKNLIRILISVLLFLAGLLISHPLLSLLFLLVSYLLVGLYVLKEAAEGIIRGQIFDENFLMAVATIGAVFIGEYHEAAAVMLFYQIGEWFQQYAVGRSRASITNLMDIRPDTANVERNGALVTIDPEEAVIGDIVVIRPGERIPLDGLVLEGTSALDTAALTGESLPRDVKAGDEVISGCINLTGLLRIQATRLYTDSTVAKILDLVENASDQKARVEGFITRFARVYTPLVCGVAMLLFLLPPLLLNGSWKEWGYRALSFLVVSCPCALVISVPLSFFGGIGSASRCGILIKGSNYIEVLAKAETVLLDKTGTLTEGRFSVSSLHPEGVSEDELLQIAAAAESVSTHPISRSICAACHDATTGAFSISSVQEIAGEGIIVQLDHTSVAVGNKKLMKRLNVPVSDMNALGTVIYTARDCICIGAICMADSLKDSAEEAIMLLRKSGVRKTVMLSGDNKSSAHIVAEALKLDEVYAPLLPAEKVACAERFLNAEGRKGSLLFVGDGINDAPLLMRADAGIAMGAMGSDAAVEAADVVLMDDDPRKIALAIAISRRTVAIAQQNIFFALGVKLAVLLLASIGLAGMWLAVFADVGVSILAILNAMRALKTPKLQ